LQPVQQALIEQDALQCGYCTAGVITASVSLLFENPTASEADITERLDESLCRCDAHKRSLKAVRSVALNPKS